LKDIGLGASVYLLTIKAFAFFFMILAIINIPILVIYSYGSISNNDDSVFAPFNLGNIGESRAECII